jgi:glucose/arabinose dehydrogenase
MDRRGAGARRPLIGLLLAVMAGCASDSAPTAPTITATPPAPSIAPVPATIASTTLSSTSTTAASTTTVPPPLLGLGLEVVADDARQPVLLTALAGDPRLLVVERAGTVRILDPAGGWREEPYLDIRDRVNPGGIEQGLLGLAFHPDFPRTGRVFAYYSFGAATTRLVEFAADAERADPGSETVLLSFDKPTERHNGGMLQFGPDGYLYLSLGEGGAASVHSQDPGTLLSSILRLDVDGADPYAVPPDNPFVAGGGAPEVWAYGLRNPWRFSIDPVERLVYVADVGHEDWEEVNVVSLDTGGGSNFGWLRMEGTHCFQRGCDPEAEGLTLPVVEYPHSEGCSVTGGFVYHGSAIPELAGHYLYSDWCGGWLRSFRYEDGRAVDERDWSEGLGRVGQVDGFGMDSEGELYLLTWDGVVGRLVPRR